MSLVPHVRHHMLLVFVSLLLCSLTSGSKEDANMTITSSCKDKERQALLSFKANIVDVNNVLSDWGNKTKMDCCRWWGVNCSETGHVTQLDLNSYYIDGLSGNISPLLSSLPQLEYLDLSGIDFQLNHIPDSFNSLVNLQYLGIYAANLSGSIPYQLAYLSNLRHLDLSSNFLSGVIPVSFGDLKLTFLDLSENLLEGPISNSFGNWSSLVYLDLSKNHLNGSVPNFVGCSSNKESISNSSSLYNRRGSSITECPPLQHLDLSRNNLTGSLPDSMGELLNLEYLDVSSNSLEGLIYDVHFLNLSQLTYLDLSFNSFRVNLSSDIRFGFKLNTIRLRFCKLGPSFPMWIQTQRNFTYLDISNAGISDRIPRWFWDLPPELKVLNLSSNEIKGTLPNIMSTFIGSPGVDLSYNQLEGVIPVLPKLASLNLSRNRFSGTLSFLCQINSILSFLDLSNNLLSGDLPDCWRKFEDRLIVLNLSNNSLSGKIPSSLGFLSSLEALYLRSNAFVGEIPTSLSNCTELRFLDLGENKFSGNIPACIGEKLSKLYVLVLRSNRLVGSLSSHLCLLSNLQFLDFSKNGLSGNIPRCFGNFTAMATRQSQDDLLRHYYISYIENNARRPCLIAYYCRDLDGDAGGDADGDDGGDALFIDNALVAWKGTMREFGRGLYLLKSMDISSNKLHGELPYEITNLREVVSLDFSHNKLQGEIPKLMGQLKYLQSLDLSRNEFSGNIPSSLSQITFLSYLNLSFNNLSGRIPLGSQLQLFDASSYTGNPRLCGDPLTGRCGLPPPPATVVGTEDGDEFWTSYYTGMSAGFAVGFCGICGALFLNRWCGYFFFASLNNMKDWIYVTAVVYYRNLHRKFRQ